MKQFNSPFTLATPPLDKAWLTYSRYMGRSMEFPLLVVNNPDGTSTLTTNRILPAAVLRLRVVPLDPKCCCRTMMVYAPGCHPSVVGGTYDGDAGVPVPVPSCDPEEEAEETALP